MIKKFLATASVIGLVAGTASAVELATTSAGNGGVGEPTALAAQLDYAGTGVTSVQGPSATVTNDGETEVSFYPTAGLFPTGNVLIRVEVSGGTFANTLDGSEINGPATVTGVISSDGGIGTSAVTFLASGLDACNAVSVCSIDLPLDLTGDDVTWRVGLQTDAGAPVDNSSITNLKSELVVDVANAFSATVVADTVATTAELNSTPPFSDLLGAPLDSVLGTIAVGPGTINVGTAVAPVLRTVNINLAGTPVSITNVDEVELVISGSMDPFTAAAPTGSISLAGIGALTANATTDTTNDDIAANFGGGAQSVTVSEDGTTPIQRSTYSAAITVTTPAVSPTQPITSGASFAGSLQTITREGTQITFPWTQSQTQGAASGVNSVFRFGNLDTAAAGAVFVEVKNASQAGYTNPGIVQLATSIPASGELVTNSAALETALGNYGRGDLEFTLEAQADTLTGRQFVVRNGVIQNVIGGNIQEDLQ